jgi:hypothetical protein
MGIHRFWIEIVMIATAIACALALLIATLGAVAGAAGTALGQQSNPAPATLQTYEGMVTCSRCGARHSAKFGKSAGDCTRICVHSGAQFALVDGEKVYLLDGDLNLLKKIAGERTRIMGSITGNTIRISSLAAGS